MYILYIFFKKNTFMYIFLFFMYNMYVKIIRGNTKYVKKHFIK